MAKIDEDAIANLKALFQDSEKALGSNFSQLIDFFNDNKVTDNGDGTFSVGNTVINVNDIVQEAEVRSIISSQLSSSPDIVTKDQLATKADDSKVVHLDDLLGGRNYLTNTTKPTMSNPIQFFGEVASIAGNADYSAGGVKLTTATSGETYYRFNGTNRRMPLQAGQTYTLSYTMSGTAGIYLATRILYAEDTVPTWEGLPISYHACTTKSMNYKDTFTVPDTALSLIVSVQIYADTSKNSDNTGTNYVEFSNIMLEKGEVQHDWVPALEDLGTSGDGDSNVDPSVMIKKTLTADDDVLTLDPGTYYTWGFKPKNFPALVSSWSTVVVKAVDNQPIDGKNVTITDTNASQLVNTYSGSDSTGKWSGWRVPNSTTMASKSDVTTAVSAATANMVDSTKATNFTAGLQSGGVDVATAADIKSVKDSAWYQLELPDTQYASGMQLVYKKGKTTPAISGGATYDIVDFYLNGTLNPVPATGDSSLVITKVPLFDISSILSGITAVDGEYKITNYAAIDTIFYGQTAIGGSRTQIPLRSMELRVDNNVISLYCPNYTYVSTSYTSGNSTFLVGNNQSNSGTAFVTTQPSTAPVDPTTP